MLKIRRIEPKDKELFLEMTEKFYSSDAVMHPIPEKYRADTFDEIISESPFADAFILELDEKPAGYALFSFTYSQEAGGKVVWIEELYVRESFRGMGVGKAVFEFAEKTFGAKRIRLEVEPENKRAAQLYERLGYSVLPYNQMYKEL